MLVVIGIFVYSFRSLLGGIGSILFVSIDGMIGPSTTSPIILWSILGLFVGAIAGSFVAYKKFRLAPVVVIVPMVALFLFCLFASLFKGDISGGYTKKIEMDSDLSEKDKTGDAGVANGQIVSVSASSELPATNGKSFQIRNIMDERKSTAWMENAKGAGINESITFQFSDRRMKNVREVKCVGFRIRNGYQKSPLLWNGNNRLKDFSVSHNSGRVVYLMAADLQEKTEELKFEKPVVIQPGDRLIVSIISVYYGEGSSDRTAISELVPIVETSYDN